MIRLLRDHLIVAMARSAKKNEVASGIEQVKSVPKNVSSKNAKRIAAYRERKQKKDTVRSLKQEVAQFRQIKTALKNKVEVLEAELRSYRKESETANQKEIKADEKKKAQLTELIALEESLYKKAEEAEKLHHQGKLSGTQVDSIEKKLNDMLQDILKRKEELLN